MVMDGLGGKIPGKGCWERALDMSRFDGHEVESSKMRSFGVEWETE